MFRSLKHHILKRAKQLGVLEKMEQQKTLDRAHRVLEEIVGAGAATPLHVKRGVLFVKCKSPTTAHFLRTNEERIKLVAQVSSVKFFS